MLEVNVMTEDGHVFTVNIGSFLEAPIVGASILCKQCDKMSKITKVGIPHRLPDNEQRSVDDNQSSILK